MFYLDVILKCLGILSLLTFMLIFIWGFVVFNGIYSQMRYTNYLLEKISHILNIQDRNKRFNDKLANSEEEVSNKSETIKDDASIECINEEN